MKRIIRRVQHLGQKANELKDAMSKLPPKVAEIRQAMKMTKGQLQDLRAEVESSVADLKADDDGSVIGALQEINGSEDVFRQAGYQLNGIDMELSPRERIVVHLDKVEDIHESSLRQLLKVNKKRKTTHALLSALGQADRMADQVTLTNLSYRELVVDVGPIPSVRICWRTEEVYEETTFPDSEGPPALPTAGSGSGSGSGSSSTFGPDSFFGRTSTPSPASSPAPASLSSSPSSSSLPPEQTPTENATTPIPSTAPELTGDWRHDSLARFKQMPTGSKYGKTSSR